ncbi:MAG: hypothetical protein GY821_14065 [Gammaproteobacteria bacterium]|nr:hypothetical protein [Gammaproteobacteria bacterium]
MSDHILLILLIFTFLNFSTMPIEKKRLTSSECDTLLVVIKSSFKWNMLDNKYFELMEKVDRISRCEPQQLFQIFAVIEEKSGQTGAGYIRQILVHSVAATTDAEQALWYILQYIAKNIDTFCAKAAKEVFRDSINNLNHLYRQERLHDWEKRAFQQLIQLLSKLTSTIRQYESEGRSDEKRLTEVKQAVNKVIANGLKAVSDAMEKNKALAAKSAEKTTPVQSHRGTTGSAILGAIAKKSQAKVKQPVQQKPIRRKHRTDIAALVKTISTEPEVAVKPKHNKDYSQYHMATKPEIVLDATTEKTGEMDENESEMAQHHTVAATSDDTSVAGSNWNIDYIASVLLMIREHVEDEQDFPAELVFAAEEIEPAETQVEQTGAFFNDLIKVAEYLSTTSQAKETALKFTTCMNRLIDLSQQGQEQENPRHYEIFKLVLTDLIAKLIYNLRQSDSGKRRRDGQIINEMDKTLADSWQSIKELSDEL